MSLIAELKRRNVVRVGLAYMVIGWALAQIAEFALEIFGAPPWAIKGVVVLLLLGLPLVLVFAWAFELTPDGIKREKDVDRSHSITAQTGRKLDYTIIAGLVLVAALVIARPYLPGARSGPEMPGPTLQDVNSVAVLPFVDLSQAGDQEYFADGISEEILNVLVKIPGLKVAGRTSSFSFKGQNEDLREIGAALGVNHILEGSVRRSGAKLRITAQLIRGGDGFHLWSETYDRETTDIFQIQDDIARAVAEQLALSLGLSGDPLVRQQTGDIVAYEKYLQAHERYLQRGAKNLDSALLLLTEAVARDPEYAQAWAGIAAVYAVYESYQDGERELENYEQWRAIGKAAARRAIELDPDIATAYSSLAGFYLNDQNWFEALDYIDRSVTLAPDNPSVLDSAAQNLLDLGYYERAEELARRAIEIDPLVAMFFNTLGRVQNHLGNIDKAESAWDQAINIDPALSFPYFNLVGLAMRTGNQDKFESGLIRARSAGAISDQGLDVLSAILESWHDEKAMRALLSKDPTFFDTLISRSLRDADMYISLMEQSWEAEFRPNPSVTNNLDVALVAGHPRWKEQVRRDGLLDFWRERGFPSWCRPLGDDDFECILPE
jgi:TolB-like protein/Flp pilus assembly protein TadD